MSKDKASAKLRAGTLPEFFSVADLARRWRCSTRHIRRLIDSEELPVHRLGEKLIRISAATVLLYEARCAIVSNSQLLS
jgi:excisionase family DNA binding protein